MQFYDPKTAPDVFDVVWCKWPMHRLEPGEWVRPVLVLDARLMIDGRDETEWAALTVAYGTGAEHVPEAKRANHLFIPHSDCRTLGLHKATVFKLDAGNRKRLPWAEEYFVPQEYVQSQNILAGRLNADQQALVLAGFKARGLEFPLP